MVNYYLLEAQSEMIIKTSKEEKQYIHRAFVEIVYSESVDARLRWTNRLLKILKQNYAIKKL